ncbi:IS66 family insertion sequence element accessory protein TnpB, partial [Natranaerobius trueperi]|uniref:IS66 family insertion sequence element accessory protein TnpB n=1 Tax=Natranaerobius trueperi TaxID=759412 RepID=UPI0013030BB9
MVEGIKSPEEGKFQWPDDTTTQTVSISYRQLRWLLDGLALDQRDAHDQVT